MTSTISIENLIQDLSTRSGRAILSQLGLRSPALREYLGKLYSLAPGEPGSLLADPVVEAAFGWKVADTDMRELSRAGLLRKELVRAMDEPPGKLRDDYRFRRTGGHFSISWNVGSFLSMKFPGLSWSRAVRVPGRPSASWCQSSRNSPKREPNPES